MNAFLNRDVWREPEWSVAVQEACRRLEQGEVVAYPTETVWGLAVRADHPDALARLYAVKGRAEHKPVQVSCASAALALSLAQPNAWLTALSTIWPGPLTLVTRASERCPPDLAPEGRVGLRVPNHPVAQALLRAAGGYLATTSCNLSGDSPALTEAAARTTGLADFTLPDAGVGATGQASTVLLLPEGHVIREGDVQVKALQEALTQAGLHLEFSRE